MKGAKSELEFLAITICEKLPFNITILEQNMKCKKPSDYCKYCKSEGDFSHCFKKTYTVFMASVLEN